MITIFGTAHPFRGHFGLIQRNAIGSWTQLRPRPQVLLMGNDEGIEDACSELDVTYVPGVECNEFGTPLFNSMIAISERFAQFDLMLYVSTDIMLFNDTLNAAKALSKRFKRFCGVVSRKDLDIHEPIDFEKTNWEQDTRRLTDSTAQVIVDPEVVGGDFFLFPKGLWGAFPAFAIGRTTVDNWMYYRTLAMGAALVDLSPSVTIVHQNHDHSHHPQGIEGVYKGAEAKRNLDIAGGFNHVFFITDANWVLRPEGLSRPPLRRQRIRRLIKILPVLHPKIALFLKLAKLLRSPLKVGKKLARVIR